MQTSDQPKPQGPKPMQNKPHKSNPKTPYNHDRTLQYVLSVLCLFVVLSLWIMQNSVNAYIIQTYHKSSPLELLNNHDWWTKGGQIGDKLYALHGEFTDKIVAKNQAIVEKYNQNITLDTKDGQVLAKQEPEPEMVEPDLYTLSVSAGDQIFFAGDSMMQGVAPHVQQYLQKTHGIKSVNLSKQSTGLAYPQFFNWPKTIEDTLASNPNIKILAVFLGPNDPWDMPDLKNGGKVKFQTPEWEAAYRDRMQGILDSAKNHGVKVIWITPPNMKKNKLNEQMVYINDVMKKELDEHGILTIDSRPLLGGVNNVYSDYLVKDGESIKMRSGDGIHFTVKGQKIVAQALQDQLTIIP